MSGPRIPVALAFLAGAWLLAIETMSRPSHSHDSIAPELGAYSTHRQERLVRLNAPQEMEMEPDSQAVTSNEDQPPASAQQTDGTDVEARVQALMLTRMD